ncbi:thioesterase family protein [Nocardioides sp. Y6]|uniref:Thioesterase family protein n=1 Tax=Nocardioides malaquae TaxID=2773426 RepID=A0ABR9RPR5_9ACTN|nr:thioesterase family protein [Nocardioides malaquae]MBE7323562.1 thioesterase family protein [Nocardioides malaquae]
MTLTSGGGDGLYVLLKTEEEADGTVVETFSSSEGVLSAWGPIQHGGPVCGILTRAIERCQPRVGTRLSRIAVEILGPVPVDEVRVQARVVRPGRRIELVQASLEARDESGEWRPAATASAWRLATQPTDDVERHADPVIAVPDDVGVVDTGLHLPDIWPRTGFISSVHWHITESGDEPGQPTMAWIKLLRPLVEGEETTPTVRLMTVADVANGVGARLDPLVHTFLNADVTVHLHAQPAGEWTGIRAETSVGPDGIGLSAASLHGSNGPVGRIAQTLLVERHGPFDA